MATMVEAQTRSGLIRSFADLGREDVAFAGGKGANLGELTRGGFSVPAGFVVGAPAYDLFVTVGGLRDRIAERLAGVNVDDPEALRRAADEVRAMVAAEPVPGSVSGIGTTPAAGRAISSSPGTFWMPDAVTACTVTVAGTLVLL